MWRLGGRARGHPAPTACAPADRHRRNPDWSSPIARIRWLLDTRFRGNRSAFAKAIIRMAPTNMPWGLREMHVSDPDGNVLALWEDKMPDAHEQEHVHHASVDQADGMT